MLQEEYIAKIEGHGKLNIDYKNQKANLIIDESERLIEGIVLGRPYCDAPFITSRICGVCPIAHNLASITALENALKISVNRQTEILRKILLSGQMIQSHALHLYFFALGDYLNVDSTLTLAKTRPEIFASAIKLKTTSDHIADVIGGRNVHPTTTVAGGFLKIPDKTKLEKLLEECQDVFIHALKTVKLFLSFTYPDFQKVTKYLALSSARGYATISDTVETSNSLAFKVKNYTKYVKEKVINGMPAKVSTLQGNNFMVGALARLSLHSSRLNPKAKELFRESLNKIGAFPAFNSFHNNFAQSIEIVHFLEEAMNLIKKLLNDKNYKYIPPVDFKIRACYGFGAIEAPRGILYHFYELDKSGKIKNCNIITPTAQSLNNLSEDANELLKQFARYSKDRQSKLVEQLIRAYDPCITCSVH